MKPQRAVHFYSVVFVLWVGFNGVLPLLVCLKQARKNFYFVFLLIFQTFVSCFDWAFLYLLYSGNL